MRLCERGLVGSAYVRVEATQVQDHRRIRRGEQAVLMQWAMGNGACPTSDGLVGLNGKVRRECRHAKAKPALASDQFPG